MIQETKDNTETDEDESLIANWPVIRSEELPEKIRYEAARASVEADPANGVEEQEARNATITIGNRAGTSLPATGGSTIVPHIILGTLLTSTAAFGALYELKKRKKHD